MILQRKLIQLSPSTYVVSLPTEWLKKQNLKKGSSVVMDVTDSSVHIESSSRRVKPKISVDLHGLNERMVRWYISALYKKGFDELEINYDTEEQFTLIQKIQAETLMGYELVETKLQCCVLKNVIIEDEKEFETMLSKAFMVTVQMAEKVHKSLQLGVFENPQNFFDDEVMNNKLTNFCEKLINSGKHAVSYPSFLYLIVWNLEKIADTYKYIVQVLQGRKFVVDEQLLDASKMILAMLRKYYSLFYKYDLSLLNLVEEEKKKILKTLDYNPRNHDNMLLQNHFFALKGYRFHISIDKFAY